MASQPTQPQAEPQAQPQQPPQQPPPDCLLHIILDVKCARATHDFLTEIFPVPASEGRIFLHPGDDQNDETANANDNDNDNGDNDKDDNGNSEDSPNNDRDAVFVFPYMAVRFTSSNACPCCAPGPRPAGAGGVELAVLVDDVQLVRARLAQRGVRFREVPAGADGMGWLEFLDPDGYCWRVGRLVWEEVRRGAQGGAPGVVDG